MIRLTSKGNFEPTRGFLNRLLKHNIFSTLDTYGRMGVEALSNATPVATGLSSQSWGYRIIKHHSNIRIEWYNTNVVNGTPVVILIQYGHGTGTGGYVQGRDFINPVVRPLFDKIADDMWKKVTA